MATFGSGGRAVADGAGIQASLRVKTAIAALELIEQGVLQRAQFATLGSQKAGELVRLTRAALKAKEESDAATARVKEEALKRAESQGNKNATEALKRELASVSEEAEKKKLQTAQHTAKQAASLFAQGESVARVREAVASDFETRERTDLRRTLTRTNTKGYTVQEKTALAQRLDKVLVEGGEWSRALRGAGDTKGDKELLGAIKRLAQRAEARAKEYIAAQRRK